MGKLTAGYTARDYEKPINVRVASFIGEANFLDTKIIDANEKSLEAAIEGKVLELKNKKGFDKDDHVVTLVRPEDLKVWGRDEVEPSDKMFAATVEEVIYKGARGFNRAAWKWHAVIGLEFP